MCSFCIFPHTNTLNLPHKYKLSIILLILTLLFAVAAIAGIVYLIIIWSKGMLSRTAVIVIISVVVIAVALALFDRLKGGD